jgi:hypothetical protein
MSIRSGSRKLKLQSFSVPEENRMNFHNTLGASAISLLANLGTSRTIIEGLSQSPALIMIAGYAAFVPGLAIVYFHNRWTGGWPMLVTVMGMALAGRRPPAHGVPHKSPH